VTANEPPNPYSPPTSSSSDGRANAPPPAANAAESVRGAATAAALLGFPLGAGFYILGRRRPAVAFASAGILVGALATASIRAPAPKLFLIALGAAVGLWLAAALGTMKARPGPTPVRRAAPWTIVPIALALLINAAVKHWLIEKMPPTYRTGLVFVDDSQGHGSLANMVNEFGAWGDAFAPAPVGFQFGYQSDKSWWSALPNPPRNIGNALLSTIPNTRDLLWVDFTAYDIWPPE